MVPTLTVCRKPCTNYSSTLSTQEEWAAVGGGGQKFDQVDLREDWADFDEKLGESVSVMGLESKFELHKGK
jgi:hypothetical protein